MKCPNCRKGKVVCNVVSHARVPVSSVSLSPNGHTFMVPLAWGKGITIPVQRSYECPECSATWTSAKDLFNAVRLTDQQVSAYIDCPVYCPFCESDQIEADQLDRSRVGEACGKSEIVRDLHCEDCGRSWREHYPLAQVTTAVE